MPQTLVRLIYDTATHEIKRIIEPDDDTQLPNFIALDGESIIDITKDQCFSAKDPTTGYPNIFTLKTLVDQMVGS